MNLLRAWFLQLVFLLCLWADGSKLGSVTIHSHTRKRRELSDEEIGRLSEEQFMHLAILGGQRYQRLYGPPPAELTDTRRGIFVLVKLGEIEFDEIEQREKEERSRAPPPPKKKAPPKKKVPTSTSTCQSPDQQRPLVAYAGMKLELDCQVCKDRPVPPGSAVSWSFQPNGTTTTKTMDTVKGLRNGYEFHEDKRQLLFPTIGQRNAGKYFCKPESGGDLFGKYDVTVIEDPYFHLLFESLNDQPYGEQQAKDGTTLFTLWSTWTGCNHCGELGEKFQFGYCYARYRQQEYPEGVPCRSNVLTYSERQLFSYRRDEKIIRTCEEACPKGKEGNSMSDSKAMETYHVDFDLGRPKLPPEVKKQTLYIDQGSSMELFCPGGGLQDAIRWQNGTQHLMQTRLRTQRVNIDAVHVLRIRNVVPEDGQVYTCYHNNEPVARMTVNVMEPVTVNNKVKNNLLYVGVALTGLVGLIIWASIYKNRKRHSFDG
ncbi:Ig-like V-type domain-containing protein FAM187A isoform X2 [Patiria miniata]|uniref:Ig-like domain-containing protein n=1 Tax=Patiria miniata TaxID=46514 RepID=A0A914BRE9_PATMI|nr:Ig-like V-type domain-containing protein FAM187A isoform X2 [Patiria miniata]